VSATSDLIVLNYADYLRLRRELKATDLDLCYAAQATRPIRMKWSQDLLQQEDFLREVRQRRPLDPSYCIASVLQIKKATWLQPDQFAVTFHSVGARQADAFQRYLTERHVRSSPNAPREMLVKTR
jgi:hypothetical protein